MFHDNDIVRRATLARLREFLLHGVDTDVPEQDSMAVLADCERNAVSCLQRLISDPDLYEEAADAMADLLAACKNAYLEQGLQAGARLLYSLCSPGRE